MGNLISVKPSVYVSSVVLWYLAQHLASTLKSVLLKHAFSPSSLSLGIYDDFLVCLLNLRSKA